jgi:hypothetical protein
MFAKKISISLVIVLVFTHFSAARVAYAEEEHDHMHVSIDVKPGSYPNSINLKSKGLIPVALFGSAEFDVNQVSTDSVTFGPMHHHTDGGAPAVKFHSKDVNLDGYLDLVFFFKPAQTGLQASDTTACLHGNFLDGSHFCGHDDVRVID